MSSEVAVDRAGRDELAGLIVSFLRREMGSETFARRVGALAMATTDRGLHDLACQLQVDFECWCWDCETHDPLISVDEGGWDYLLRALAFLGSGLQEPGTDGDDSVYPFSDGASWSRCRHWLDRYELPAYDPTLHSVPRQHRRFPLNEIVVSAFSGSVRHPLVAALVLLVGLVLSGIIYGIFHYR